MNSDQDAPALEVNESLNLQENRVLIHAILKHLPIKCLNQKTRVCKNWNLVAKAIKRTRTQASWLTYSDQNDGDIQEQVEDTLKILSSQPTTAIVFSSSTFKSPVGTAKRAKRSKFIVADYLQHNLPQDCQIVNVISSGVVATNFDNGTIKEFESGCCASFLLLPTFAGIDVHVFQLPSGDQRIFDNIDEVTHIPVDKHVKLILLFPTDPNSPTERAFGKQLCAHYKNAVIAGGYVTSIATSLWGREMKCGAGIAFCGEDIKVTSVVQNLRVDDEKGYDGEDGLTCLKKLKAANIPEKNSIAFMFACVGRGAGLYDGLDNAESTAFHKLFPTVPLVGFFGYGEIGFNSSPADSEEDRDKSMSQSLFHTYKTIFVHMSLK